MSFRLGEVGAEFKFLRETMPPAVIRVARRPTPEQAEMLNYMYVVH